ncbi:hypothetical protein [Geodermatophilus sp. SYSU D00815]
MRRDTRSSFGEYSGTAEGVPMTLELTIADLANGGVPFEGVAVYVRHCTREGGYSLYSEGITDQNCLRGVQVADASGKVSFTSVFPACYDGRWPADRRAAVNLGPVEIGLIVLAVMLPFGYRELPDAARSVRVLETEVGGPPGPATREAGAPAVSDRPAG